MLLLRMRSHWCLAACRRLSAVAIFVDVSPQQALTLVRWTRCVVTTFITVVLNGPYIEGKSNVTFKLILG